MKLKLIFSTMLVCLSLNAKALTMQEFRMEHKQKQQKFFANMDYCSNIGAKDIFELGTKNLKYIKENLETLKANFNLFKEKKAECFAATRNYLDGIIADNFITMQTIDNTVTVELQNGVDQDFLDVVKLREKINLNLIDSILKDVKQSLKSATEDQLINTFITESSTTKQLISQELNVVYNSIQLQLNLDKDLLSISENTNILDVADISVRSAFLNLSRALLLFENINQEPKMYNIAKIKTFLDTAYNKMQELKAYSKDLDSLDSKKEINQILNQLSILTVDVEVVLKDLHEDVFTGDYLNWASMLYQQISATLEQVQAVLDSIYLMDLIVDEKPLKKLPEENKNSDITKDGSKDKSSTLNKEEELNKEKQSSKI